MRGFHSLLNKLSLALGLLLLNPCFVLANEIEIDLSGNSAPASKSSSLSGTQSVSKPSSTKQNVASPASKKDENENQSLEENASNAGSVVNRVSVLSEDSGVRVSLDGQNLPEPTITKISSKKILIKFAKTRLKIPKKLREKSKVVKNVRSSSHAGTAWIVLDVSILKKWQLEKTEAGYSLLLNSSQDVNEASKESVASTLQANPSENGTEKGLFSRLIDTSVKPGENSIKLVLTSDGPSKYTVRKLSRPDKIIIHFHDTKLEVADKLKRFKSDDPELKKGGLLSIELRQIGPQFSPISEVMLTVLPGTIDQIDRDLNQVVLTLTAPPMVQKPVEKKGNLNQLVSMDLQSAGLESVVKTLADEAGFEVNLVSGPLAGTVNQKFKDVPFKTALADLLAPAGYAYDIQGNTLRVGLQTQLISTKIQLPHVTELVVPAGGMTPADFDKLVRLILPLSNASLSVVDPVRNVLILNGTASDIEEYKKGIKDLQLDSSTNSGRITRVVKLNYSDPAQLSGILAPYLTPIGKVQISGNRLVLWETATNMGVLLELIHELDVKPAQVLIESNIVELDSEADLNMGVSWSITSGAGLDPSVQGTLGLPPNNAQALPGIITFGTVKSGLNISAQLQALETHKKGKIISRPRIATASGIQAEINEVQNIIVSAQTQTVGLGGVVSTTTTFITVPLPIDLKVTPRITEDGRITTVVNASITSQTGPAAGSGAAPPTSVQTATTTITTKNGETIVIGGLVRDVVQDVTNGVPLLSSIPILGSLFQEHDKLNRKEELVIFITPTLLED